jgi:hypothetical protein
LKLIPIPIPAATPVASGNPMLNPIQPDMVSTRGFSSGTRLLVSVESVKNITFMVVLPDGGGSNLMFPEMAFPATLLASLPTQSKTLKNADP